MAVAEQLDRQENPLGRQAEPVRLVPARPAARLAGLVREYRGYRDAAPAARIQRESATSVIPLVFEFAAGWRVASPGSAYAPERLRGFVAGLSDAYALVEPAGAIEGVQVDLTPIGARRLLGVPMHELANRAVSLEALVGRPAAFLTEVLVNTPGWAGRFGVLDAALSHRLEDSGEVSAEVEWAWVTLERSGGRVAIGELCSELGWSRKRLVARFREDIGLPPKTAARIIRFERLQRRLRLKALTPALSQKAREFAWADLALECGYADQAHLVREVRRLAGVTPTQLLRETIVQDASLISG